MSSISSPTSTVVVVNGDGDDEQDADSKLTDHELYEILLKYVDLICTPFRPLSGAAYSLHRFLLMIFMNCLLNFS